MHEMCTYAFVCQSVLFLTRLPTTMSWIISWILPPQILTKIYSDFLSHGERGDRLHFTRLNVCVCIISSQGQWGRSQKVHAAHGKHSFPWQGLLGLKRSSTRWCENDGGVFSGNEAVFRFISVASLPGKRIVLQRSLWTIHHSRHMLIIQQNTIYECRSLEQPLDSLFLFCRLKIYWAEKNPKKQYAIQTYALLWAFVQLHAFLIRYDMREDLCSHRNGNAKWDSYS